MSLPSPRAAPSSPPSTNSTSPYTSSPLANHSFRSSTETLLSASHHHSPYLPSKESFDESRHTIDIEQADGADDEYSPDTDQSYSSTQSTTWSSLGDRPSTTARLATYLKKNPSARVYALAGSIAFFLLLSIVSTTTPVVHHIGNTIKDIDVSSIQQKITGLGQSKSTCDDPFAMPGYIWYGKGHQDVRWVPYKHLDPETIGDPEDAKIHDPEKESKLNKTAMNSPPSAELLPVELSKLFKTVQRRQDNSDVLEFMRNKHIMIYGSSLDREMTKMFCNDHEQVENPKYTGGKLYEYGHHRFAYCHFKDYNFTLSSSMHFGLHQSTFFRGDDDPKIGTQIEQRLQSVVVPLAEKFGKPDLFVFSSGLWDLMFFNKIERLRDPKFTRSMYLPVSYERLMWQRARLAEVIETLRSTFPGTPLLYRTTTQPGSRRSDQDDEMIAVFQINQSAKALMRLLKVPLFHWSDLIKGSHSYQDFVHFETDSRQNWLYGEMLLHALQQVSDPKADTSCWLDR